MLSSVSDRLQYTRNQNRTLDVSKMNSPTYWQSENTTQSPGVTTYPQFVTFDMVQNILAIFISPNDNPSTCYLDKYNVLLMGRNIAGWLLAG